MFTTPNQDQIKSMANSPMGERLIVQYLLEHRCDGLSTIVDFFEKQLGILATGLPFGSRLNALFPGLDLRYFMERRIHTF
jgi:hypothetical protein